MVEYLKVRLNKSNNQKLVYIPKESLIQAGDLVKVVIVETNQKTKVFKNEEC